jgi:hypothetical protein
MLHELISALVGPVKNDHRDTEVTERRTTKYFLCVLCASVAQSFFLLAVAGCRPHQIAPTTSTTTAPAPAAAQPLGYKCHYTPTPIKIDGKLDDPAWQHAQKITLFYLHKSDRPAPQGTQAMMMWDDNNIYVAFKCQDDEIFSPFTKNDEHLWEDDVVEVFFGPDPHGSVNTETLPPVQYEFEFSPKGLIYDSLIRSLEGTGIADGAKWSSHAKVAAAIDRTSDGRDRGWTVEVAIPLSDFAEFLNLPTATVGRALPHNPPAGTSPAAEVRWRFMMARKDVSKSHKADTLTSTSPNIGSFHEYQRYLPMRFVK